LDAQTAGQSVVDWVVYLVDSMVVSMADYLADKRDFSKADSMVVSKVLHWVAQKVNRMAD
jgi:hypothetical protein